MQADLFTLEKNGDARKGFEMFDRLADRFVQVDAAAEELLHPARIHNRLAGQREEAEEEKKMDLARLESRLQRLYGERS